MKIIVGYDATPLIGKITGTGIYLKNLILSLTTIYPNLKLKLFCRANFEMPCINHTQYEKIIYPFPNNTIWMQLILPLLLKKHKVDIFHSPIFLTPIINKIPTVITIHDISHILFPKFHPFIHRNIHKILLPLSLNKANHIITVSEHTKKDLIEYYHIPPEKVTVTLLAPDKHITNQIKRNNNNHPNNYVLPEMYILSVSTLEPRKNIEGLLKAFILLKQRGHTNLKLIIIGMKGWGKSKFWENPELTKIKNDIQLLGYIPSEELYPFYKNSIALVYPSFYEGFGLPPVEAMACGTPVITSCVSSLPEVIGSSGILINPHSPQEIASAVEKLITNTQLKETLSIKGKKRAAGFSWEKTAKETFQIYKHVLLS